jgi:hypothetical protein
MKRSPPKEIYRWKGRKYQEQYRQQIIDTTFIILGEQMIGTSGETRRMAVEKRACR